MSDNDTTSTRTVLLISSGYHLYREYLLRQISGAARVKKFRPRNSSTASFF